MTTPIRQTITDAIKAQLQTITVANDYSTNAGNNVFEWRCSPLEDDEVPGIIFREVDRVKSKTAECELHELMVDLELYATTPADTRKLLSDVVSCIGKDIQFGLPHIIQDTRPGEEKQVISEHKGNLYSYLTAQYVVSYYTNKYDPYTVV